MSATGWKVLTHDYRPPIQRGDPVWDGTEGTELPAVDVDTSGAQCAPGWNYTTDPATAWRIAGLWPDGWPSRLIRVEPVGDWIERGDKRRASQLRLLSEATPDEETAALFELAAPFGAHREAMAFEMGEWRRALGRPRRNVRDVERGLRRALKARGLKWKLERHEVDARAARAARAARDARAAWAAWDARAAWAAWDARAAWAARAAWDARDARDAWDARAAWAAWDARDAWDAWAARDAWDARAALTVTYPALEGWTDHDPHLLTVGIRDAYEAGLVAAMPTGDGTLGWSMRGEDDEYRASDLANGVVVPAEGVDDDE